MRIITSNPFLSTSKLFHSLIFILVIFLLSIPAYGQKTSSNKFDIDFSGINAFWRVYEILSKDSEPPTEEWDRLFSTPGYAMLEERERRRKSLTEAFRLAYMPSRQTERDNIIKEGKGWLGFILPHLRDIPNHKGELEKFLNESSVGSLFEAARLEAQKFLPDETIKLIPPPSVSFIFFSSRGYSRILLDPLDLMLHPDKVGLVGHELHHYYRNKIAREGKPFGDDLLAWAITNVEVEGIAGNIDKGKVPAMSDAEIEKRYVDKQSGDYFKQYKIEYARSNEWLRFTESILERIAANHDLRAKLGEQLHKELPDNGRAMGTFMSETIVKQFGRKSLQEVVGDAYAFWLHYNEAAKRTKNSSYVLSEKAINVIKEVRDKYQISPKTKMQ